MATLNVAWNATGVTAFGAADNGAAFGASGGTKIACNGTNTEFDFLFTNTDTVILNYALIVATSDIVITLMDTSGAVLQTANVSTLSTGSTSAQALTLFSSLTLITTYWLRIVSIGGNSDFFASNQLVQLSGTAVTPSISYPTGYSQSIVNFGAQPTIGFPVGGTDISGNYSTEGGTSIAKFRNFMCLKNLDQATYLGNTGKLRIKGTVASIAVYCYNATNTHFHVNRVAGDGSDGTPLDVADFSVVTSNSGVIGPWYVIATGMPTTGGPFIYEISMSSNNNGIIAGIMTAGGTGFVTNDTSGIYTRALGLAGLGDSRVAQVNGTDSQSYFGSLELLGQAMNRQILNVGIPGLSLSSLSAGTQYLAVTSYGQNPAVVMVDCGINDIQAGSPAVATMQGYLVTLVNKIRAVGGYWATVPIYIEGIKPSSAVLFSYIHPYNVGYAATVATYNSGGDANVHYIDVEPWQLAGASYNAGSTFVTTNFDDGLHLNSPVALNNPGPGYVVEEGFLFSIFGTSSGPIGSPDLVGGMQQLTGGI